MGDALGLLGFEASTGQLDAADAAILGLHDTQQPRTGRGANSRGWNAKSLFQRITGVGSHGHPFEDRPEKGQFLSPGQPARCGLMRVNRSAGLLARRSSRLAGLPGFPVAIGKALAATVAGAATPQNDLLVFPLRPAFAHM